MGAYAVMSAFDTEFTEDLIYGGAVRVRQPARGYRVNVDTVLLAASLPATGTKDGARVIELGCGVGAALAVMAHNHADAGPNTRFCGLERDPGAAALARANVALNGLSERIQIIEADALDPGLDLGVFDRVLVNPPYAYAGEGAEPAAARRAAHIADRPIADWIKLWSNRMGAHASMTMIHRPERLTEILSALEGRLGGVQIFPIRANSRAPAHRLLVRAWKGSRAPLTLLAGLVLHPIGADRKHTPEAEAILRGRDFIDFA